MVYKTLSVNTEGRSWQAAVCRAIAVYAANRCANKEISRARLELAVASVQRNAAKAKTIENPYRQFVSEVAGYEYSEKKANAALIKRSREQFERSFGVSPNSEEADKRIDALIKSWGLK